MWIALVLGGCPTREPYDGAFQLPVAAAVLQPEVGGPFQEPVGFVANGHGGEIIPLALKQGRFLSDDPTISFLRTNPLATGALRRLTSVAVVAPTLNEVTLWAGDELTGSLLRIPYLYDCELTPERRECEDALFGAPVEQAAYWDPVSEPDTAFLTRFGVSKGYTTTETWTLTYDGAVWNVEGSRSGYQPKSAVTGVPYEAEAHRIEFTIEPIGDGPVAGDTFVLRTETGLSEIDVGGTPLALKLNADQSLIAMIVHDRSDDRPVIRWFDPAAGTDVGDVALPPDAWPHRITFAEDGSLFVADREHAAVWEVAPGALVATEHPTPWPTLDVAALDGEDVRRLYVVPIDSSALWMFDRDTDLVIDVNPAIEGDQGMPFTASVLGIEAFPRPHWMPEFTDDAVRRIGRSVAVSLSNNRLVFAHEETGCLVQDNLGPRTENAATSFTGPSDYTSSFASTFQGPPELEISDASGRHVLVNTCAGIARSEIWSVVFDQNLQGWRVRGTLTGEQEALAYENERYLSDNGEVSFVIRSGATPSQDGWRIEFTVNGGFAQATGDNDGDGDPEITLGLTGDPVYFEYRVGLAGPIGDHDGEGWYPVDIRSYMLVPGASTNQVGRVDPQLGIVEVGWR